MDKPKDYRLAQLAYETFYNNPAVPFGDLGHEYVMRWVMVARAVLGQNKKVPVAEKADRPGPKRGFVLGPRMDYTNLNEKDRKHFTDKPWRAKSREEIKARARVSYREQSAKRIAEGRPTKHQASSRFLNGA